MTHTVEECQKEFLGAAAEIDELIARLEAAEGPDRELDARIAYSFLAQDPFGDGKKYLWPEDNPSWSFAMAYDTQPSRLKISPSRAKEIAEVEFQREDGKWILVNTLRLLHYTASMDAAIAFTEAKLPGWRWAVFSGGASLCRPYMSMYEFYVGHKVPTIALLIATLKAMKAELERDKRMTLISNQGMSDEEVAKLNIFLNNPIIAWECYQACAAINPEHPERVAEGLGELIRASNLIANPAVDVTIHGSLGMDGYRARLRAALQSIKGEKID